MKNWCPVCNGAGIKKIFNWFSVKTEKCTSCNGMGYLPPPNTPKTTSTPPKEIYLSRKLKIMENAVAWLDKEKLAPTPINIITALHELGYINWDKN